MRRRLYSRNIFLLLSVTVVFVFACSPAPMEKKPAVTVKTMQFDHNEPTVYQKTFPLVTENFESLFKKSPYLVDRSMGLPHIMAMTADDVTVFETMFHPDSLFDERDTFNSSLLHYAALNPNPEITQFLLDRLASFPNRRNELPLDWAAAANPNLEVVRLLYDAESALSEFSCGRMYRLLERAAESNTNPDVLHFLLEQSKETKAFSDLSLAPILNQLFLSAAKWNANPEILDVLVKAGANPNPKTRNWPKIPMNLAARHNPNPAVIERLIEFGAEFGLDHPENSVRASSYYKFFAAASDNPSIEVSKWFVAQGFDPHLQDREKRSACDHAFRSNRNPEVVRFYFDLLEEKGIGDADRQRLFAHAHECHNTALAELLLDQYLGRDEVQGAPMSAFVPFYGYSHEPLWERLLEYGADPHAENDLGLTMTDIAAAYQTVYQGGGLFAFLERLGIEGRKSDKVQLASYRPLNSSEADLAAWESVFGRVATTDFKRLNTSYLYYSHRDYTISCPAAATEQARKILHDAAEPSLTYVPTNLYLIKLAELQMRLGFLDDTVKTVQKIKNAKLPPGKSLEEIREKGYEIIPDDNAVQQSELFQRDTLLRSLVTHLLLDQQSQRAARAANMIFSTPVRDNALMQVFYEQCHIMYHTDYPGKYHEMWPKALQTIAYLSDFRKDEAFLHLTKMAMLNFDVPRMKFFLDQATDRKQIEDKLPSLFFTVPHRGILSEEEAMKQKAMRAILAEIRDKIEAEKKDAL